MAPVQNLMVSMIILITGLVVIDGFVAGYIAHHIAMAERALKDSERRLTDIINFLPDATFAIDRQGTVIAWNKAIEEMTGVKAADMLGMGNFA
ncbi:MAG: PAS domain S-box protein, partial [Syntrophales bacterium LBB04]|nr:PAS domain S-box protein [Syntrophales bacterium LBB04]